jgi:hypothetical protein
MKLKRKTNFNPLLFSPPVTISSLFLFFRSLFIARRACAREIVKFMFEVEEEVE